MSPEPFSMLRDACNRLGIVGDRVDPAQYAQIAATLDLCDKTDERFATVTHYAELHAQLADTNAGGCGR